MKVRTFIITASVTLALVAPAAANAAATRTPVLHDDFGSQQVVKHGLTTKQQAAKIKALVAKNKALVAKNRALAAKNSALIAASRPHYEPGFTPGPSQPSEQAGANDCADYATNCTPEQECTLWGFNCDLVPPVNGTSSDVAPDSETPVADSFANTSENTDSPAELAPVDPSSYLVSQDDLYWDC